MTGTEDGRAWVALPRGDEVGAGPGAAGPTLQVPRREPRGGPGHSQVLTPADPGAQPTSAVGWGPHTASPTSGAHPPCAEDPLSCRTGPSVLASGPQEGEVL